MKYFYLFLISFSFAAILHVDGDNYTAIQSAVDDALTSDTVLVYNGIYFENLDIDKSITLASLAMYDDLETWYEYDPVSGQYEIFNYNILNTIIDGSQPVDTLFQSSVLVRSTDNDCISPTVMGFTIQGGMGTFVTEEIDNPVSGEMQEVERMIGGGIYSYLTNADIHHNQFSNNGDPSVQNGGAGYSQTSSGDWDFSTRDSNPRCEIESISMHDNFYRDNDAVYGNTFSNRTFTNDIDMSNSLFDIYNCPESNVTGVWVDIAPEAEIGYDGSLGDLCAVTDDVWVSPAGSDNTGDATQNNPIKTIKYALEIIAPTEDNPTIIHLDEGTYSPNYTGESFPIMMISNIHLSGVGEELTILDARQSNRVINIEYVDNVTVSDLTITRGLAGTLGLADPDTEFPWSSGGGLSLWSSDPILTNLTITGNAAGGAGGGLCIFGNSNPIFDNITISQNESTWFGGGLYISESNPTLTNGVISQNTGKAGGGIMLVRGSGTFTNLIIDSNISNGAGNDFEPPGNGGGIWMRYSDPIMTNLTVTNNFANYWGGGINIFAEDDAISATNVTIVGNTAGSGGGGMNINGESDLVSIKNSILWENNPNSLDAWDPIVTYSNIQGFLAPGPGNIHADPLFTDPENNDYSLQEGSPCIDAGTADLDEDGLEDITDYFGSAPDMGAYEFEFTIPSMPGDLNGDYTLNVQDIVILVSFVLLDDEYSEEQFSVADLNQDGLLNVVDILLLINIILNP